MENDLEPDFKADFKFKNPDSPYIYPTTLKALGIKMPAFEYQQSLRYTRDGYSDMVGENISKAQIEFWNALTNEERTSRAKKSVENFENWTEYRELRNLTSHEYNDNNTYKIIDVIPKFIKDVEFLIKNLNGVLQDD